MNSFRKKAAAWFYKYNNRGISNLMLYIGIGNLITWAVSLIDPSNMMYQLLCFQPQLILRGQVWRLISYVFTYMLDATGLGVLFSIITLFCYYYIGSVLEQVWGTLRFNCYYLIGVLIPDLFGLIFGFQVSAYYLNLSLFLAIATIIPEQRFYLMYVIPVKAKWLAWFYFVVLLVDILRNLAACIAAGVGIVYYLYSLYPLLALLNYFLFFGRDIVNVLPDFMKHKATKTQRAFRRGQQEIVDAGWSGGYRNSTGEKPYRHKCTVCGRTDVTNPELDFRYCSRCVGYYCYCEEHINSHVHIRSGNFTSES